MEVIETGFEGLLIIKPAIFSDERGIFMETYNQRDFARIGIRENFLQDNQSVSKKGVLRGLHLQLPPYAQAKLVRVIKGHVMDVVVDLRKKSPTYGKFFSLDLRDDGTMLFVPEGFAHGFYAYEDDSVFFYKCSSFYQKSHEVCIRYSDPQLAIPWPDQNPIVSEKDQQGQLFAEFCSPF